jgi:hypothetical protein
MSFPLNYKPRVGLAILFAGLSVTIACLLAPIASANSVIDQYREQAPPAPKPAAPEAPSYVAPVPAPQVHAEPRPEGKKLPQLRRGPSSATDQTPLATYPARADDGWLGSLVAGLGPVLPVAMLLSLAGATALGLYRGSGARGRGDVASG